jgi:RimJ/RimL family protein N-acetyltransferase
LLNVAWSSKEYLEIEPGAVVEESDSRGIFDCYTFPEHRSKGVYRESLMQLASTFQQSGTRRVLIAVDPGNIASIKGIERAGFEPLYRLTRSRRYGRVLLRRSQFAPVTAAQ